MFPTITGYYRFTPNVEENSGFFGLTLGVNEGVNNVGTGFALALGGSFGFIVGEHVHFGLFAGLVFDPSIYENSQEVLGRFFGTGLMFSLAI